MTTPKSTADSVVIQRPVSPERTPHTAPAPLTSQKRQRHCEPRSLLSPLPPPLTPYLYSM